MKIHPYLNTDLDLVAGRDLTLLVRALEASGLYSLHAGVGDDGNWYATLEVNEVADEALHLHQPELTIVVILDAIEALDASARAIWDACTTKTLDIGYQCGGLRSRNGLTNPTLTRLTALGMDVTISLYPCEPDNIAESVPQPL
ncbi:MAG: hypothetical protein BWK73_35480 [Thiothrix lacustris]|uniref:DUF4279 domain-containing protein n=1 Tax=Thiothrix lacustris TaxID=525917 RepID=A0A1Y1QGB0_9GAMM|nr:MAG: hypothetical protein BWK73_35480 [Thiothrix lacustris]